MSNTDRLTAPRVGIGYDVHRLVPGRPLLLGGIRFEHEMGLSGHSDGDVVLHALTDAILGAAGLGDIGKFFPNTERWKDSDSETFVAEVMQKISGKWTLINVDVNVLAEKVRIAPRREEVEANLARMLGVDASRVNVKGKTGDGMGPVGRGEAIEAQVIVSLAPADR